MFKATLKELYTQYTFQQDNVPTSTCKIVDEFFVKEGITYHTWSTRSTDLSIIENI